MAQVRILRYQAQDFVDVLGLEEIFNVFVQFLDQRGCQILSGHKLRDYLFCGTQPSHACDPFQDTAVDGAWF